MPTNLMSEYTTPQCLEHVDFGVPTNIPQHMDQQSSTVAEQPVAEASIRSPSKIIDCNLSPFVSNDLIPWYSVIIYII